MTGAEAVALARRRGVALGVFLGNLRAYSESKSDESLVRLLRGNKQAVIRDAPTQDINAAQEARRKKPKQVG
jgi:hypothetical protein